MYNRRPRANSLPTEPWRAALTAAYDVMNDYARLEAGPGQVNPWIAHVNTLYALGIANRQVTYHAFAAQMRSIAPLAILTVRNQLSLMNAEFDRASVNSLNRRQERARNVQKIVRACAWYFREGERGHSELRQADTDLQTFAVRASNQRLLLESAQRQPQAAQQPPFQAVYGPPPVAAPQVQQAYPVQVERGRQPGYVHAPPGQAAPPAATRSHTRSRSRVRFGPDEVRIISRRGSPSHG